jgi:GNAT superfamily N-acetyltransferase
MRTVAKSIHECHQILTALHTLTFPGDSCPPWQDSGRAWITYHDGEPVAFLYAEPLSDSWYFSRVGVLASARGHGLQRKLMARMERDLRGSIIVSTTYQNPPSANNFVRRQWLTYLPTAPWGAADTIYWFKSC